MTAKNAEKTFEKLSGKNFRIEPPKSAGQNIHNFADL